MAAMVCICRCRNAGANEQQKYEPSFQHPAYIEATLLSATLLITGALYAKPISIEMVI